MFLIIQLNLGCLFIDTVSLTVFVIKVWCVLVCLWWEGGGLA